MSGASLNDGYKSTGAVALVCAGIASAFALAACCALPVLFGSAALVLAPLAIASEPHTQLLTAISPASLIGSVAVVAASSRRCVPGSVCSRPAFRWGVIAAAVVGAALLALSKVYA